MQERTNFQRIYAIHFKETQIFKKIQKISSDIICIETVSVNMTEQRNALNFVQLLHSIHLIATECDKIKMNWFDLLIFMSAAHAASGNFPNAFLFVIFSILKFLC